MGPFYRNTSQGVGSFFDAFYEHPILIVVLVGIVAGIIYTILRKNQHH